MKKIIVIIAAALALSAPVAGFAMEGMDMDHGSMDMGHGGHMNMGNVAHEEVVDGVKATFRVISMKEHMKGMDMEMPKGMKETHHIAVEFKLPRQGRP